MNTVKQRLENRTTAVIKALVSLGDLNASGGEYTDEQVHKIRNALSQAVDESINRLRNKPDMVGFSL